MIRAATLIGVLIAGGIVARAEGAWWNNPVVRACCSDADALYADEWQSAGADVIAKVTGGGPRDHAWAPIGRVYHIPASKVKSEPGNPTGHALLFVSPASLEPYCFFSGPLI